MDNIFGGLEKFGLDMGGLGNLFEEEKEEKPEAAVPEVSEQKTVDEMEEKELLFQREVRCIVCDHKFKTLSVRTSKLRRLEADKDLRPRFKGVDTIKYDVYSCPYCGYTAMSRYFEHLSVSQIRMIKEGVSSKFNSMLLDVPDTFDYDTAIDRYKLSLFNTVVKHGSTSEKAYTCLRLSWLCRGKIEEYMAKGMLEESETIRLLKKEENGYYAQAYEGFTKAVSSEHYPICGMDQYTLEYLLAQMATKLGNYAVASKIVSRILVAKNVPTTIKNRALDLKQEIIDIIKGSV